MKRIFPTHPTNDPVIENPWQRLREFTDARIGLGRAGVSVPTKHLLAFQLAHAQAIDAVHTPLNATELIHQLTQQSWSPPSQPFRLHSRAEHREMYLQRPDYGRQLNKASEQTLEDHAYLSDETYDVAFVIVDGLSALAIEENVLPFLNELVPTLTSGPAPWTIAPLCIVEQGRVAIGDHVGELLHAKCVVVLVGERPGLSSPDSMGLYLTWGPKVGNTDAYRNCISNIRPAGLNYPEASRKARYLLNEARTKQLSGVQLKDRTDESVIEHDNDNNNFLITKKKT
ncbi:ethanolamine ammonia-lyase subunit EutC [Marinomonas piezotolerans]|uniref:Ethanolamine ammonia-lyase small subunit n=1 Tax=Marinomonas piezotolerans TaxID=2213058 RepID=A0A370U629_9GAMM|nr:ethanolamine ammonia-lyase subunit EutC [Marinomonas piezotolerans]RDL43242.1 ethanolamine ammonia-lyase subunit EutC [Marinomonas piezotolerans]